MKESIVPKEGKSRAPRLRKKPAKVPNAVAPKVFPAMSSKMAVIPIMTELYMRNGAVSAAVWVRPWARSSIRPSKKNEKEKAKRPRGAGLAILRLPKCRR